jgi:hypothetical protein
VIFNDEDRNFFTRYICKKSNKAKSSVIARLTSNQNSAHV